MLIRRERAGDATGLDGASPLHTELLDLHHTIHEDGMAGEGAEIGIIAFLRRRGELQSLAFLLIEKSGVPEDVR